MATIENQLKKIIEEGGLAQFLRVNYTDLSYEISIKDTNNVLIKNKIVFNFIICFS